MHVFARSAVYIQTFSECQMGHSQPPRPTCCAVDQTILASFPEICTLPYKTGATPKILLLSFSLSEYSRLEVSTIADHLTPILACPISACKLTYSNVPETYASAHSAPPSRSIVLAYRNGGRATKSRHTERRESTWLWLALQAWSCPTNQRGSNELTC